MLTQDGLPIQADFDHKLFADKIISVATTQLGAKNSGRAVRAARAVQQLAETTCRKHVRADAIIACRAGCANCCIVNVAVLQPEAESIVFHLLDSRSPQDLQHIYKMACSLDQATRWLDDEERIMLRKSCVFLNQAGNCTIYQFRPLLCRAVTSTDAADCKEALAMVAFGENRPIIANMLQRSIFETAFSHLGMTLDQHRMDSRSQRLTGSVRALLEKHLS